jgi:hypothetical protein
MKKVKSILKRIPKEKLIILICAIMSAITLLVSVIVFASAGAEEPEENPNRLELNGNLKSPESFSPESPQSLEFQSLDNNSCIVLSIGAFAGVELEIPEKSPHGETVIGIASGAFEGCEELETVHIPSTVVNIGEGAFRGCSSLIMISVDRSNPKLSAVGGILYSKSKNILICYPCARVGSSYLINPNVKRIAADAFYGVKHLTKLYYEGTTAEFSQIEVGIGNRIFSTLPITCNYLHSK